MRLTPTTVFTILVFTISEGAFAGLITYNGHTLDENTNIVTGGGLEWLQWTETKGQSVVSRQVV